MEGEIIIVSIVSGIFTLIGISLVNHNWFKRQELKSRYKIKEIKARKQAKLPTPPERETSPLGSLSGLLNVAKNLEPEQIGDLIELATGRGDTGGDTTGDILNDIIENNPEIVQSFIKGLSQNVKKKEPEFPAQM